MNNFNYYCQYNDIVKKKKKKNKKKKKKKKIETKDDIKKI